MCDFFNLPRDNVTGECDDINDDLENEALFSTAGPNWLVDDHTDGFFGNGRVVVNDTTTMPLAFFFRKQGADQVQHLATQRTDCRCFTVVDCGFRQPVG